VRRKKKESQPPDFLVKRKMKKSEKGIDEIKRSSSKSRTACDNALKKLTLSEGADPFPKDMGR